MRDDVDADRTIRIYKDVLYEVSPEESTLEYDSEDLDVRVKIESQVAEIRAKGYSPDIPSEWPEFTEEEMAEIRKRRQEAD